jgi:hypothetical protein
MYITIRNPSFTFTRTCGSCICLLSLPPKLKNYYWQIWKTTQFCGQFRISWNGIRCIQRVGNCTLIYIERNLEVAVRDINICLDLHGILLHGCRRSMHVSERWKFVYLLPLLWNWSTVKSPLYSYSVDESLVHLQHLPGAIPSWFALIF